MPEPERGWKLPAAGALRAFEAAARLGSFTRAAEALSQTQGAVSHQIRELEERLGARLFVREARGIALTDAGRTYLPYVRDALSRLREGARALERVREADVLTVSMSPNFAAKWLVPRLGAFAAAHPEIDLRISAAMQHVTFAGDGIDLAVRHGGGEWPGLHVVRLCEESLFPVCSPGLGAREPRIETIEDLRRHPLVHDRSRESWRDWLEALGYRAERFDLGRGPLFNQTSLAIDAAVAGQGVALARSALAALDLAAGRLVRPLPESVPAGFAYWIVCPSGREGEAKVVAFGAWLRAEAERDVAVVRGTAPGSSRTADLAGAMNGEAPAVDAPSPRRIE